MRSLYKVFLTSPLLTSPIFSQIVRPGTPSLLSPDNNTPRSTAVACKALTYRDIGFNIEISAFAKPLPILFGRIRLLLTRFAGFSSRLSLTLAHHFSAVGKGMMGWSDGSMKRLFFASDNPQLQVFCQACDRNSTATNNNGALITPIDLKIGYLDLTFITSLYFP